MKHLRTYQNTNEILEDASNIPNESLVVGDEQLHIINDNTYIPAKYIQMNRGSENFIRTKYHANKNTNVKIIFESVAEDLQSWGWILGGGSYNIYLNTSHTGSHLGVYAQPMAYDSTSYTYKEDDLGITSSNKETLIPQEILHRKFIVTMNNLSIKIERYNTEGTEIDKVWVTNENDIMEYDNSNSLTESYRTPYSTIYLWVMHQYYNFSESTDGGVSIYGYARDARIYYCKFWEGTETKREYIPVYNTELQKYGLLETVSNTFEEGYYPNNLFVGEI